MGGQRSCSHGSEQTNVNRRCWPKVCKLSQHWHGPGRLLKMTKWSISLSHRFCHLSYLYIMPIHKLGKSHKCTMQDFIMHGLPYAGVCLHCIIMEGFVYFACVRGKMTLLSLFVSSQMDIIFIQWSILLKSFLYLLLHKDVLFTEIFLFHHSHRQDAKNAYDNFTLRNECKVSLYSPVGCP